MAKRLILHAGWHKTGTTSIQRWCASNSGVLLQNGISYPVDENLIWDGHHRMAWGLGASHPNADPSFDSISLLRKYLQETDGTLLLSSEDFEFIPERGIRAIRSASEGAEVSVVIFLRNIIDYLLADYQQNVRMEETRYPHDIYRFSFQYNAYAKMDYFALLQKWASALGSDAVNLLRYEARAGSVIPTFRESLGLGEVGTENDAERANLSLKAVSLRVLQEINRTGVTSDRAEIIQKLYDLEVPGDAEFSALDPDLAEEFLKRIANRTRRVGDMFKVDIEYLLVNTVANKRHVDSSDWKDRFDAIRQEFCLQPH